MRRSKQLYRRLDRWSPDFQPGLSVMRLLLFFRSYSSLPTIFGGIIRPSSMVSVTVPTPVEVRSRQPTLANAPCVACDRMNGSEVVAITVECVAKSFGQSGPMRKSAVALQIAKRYRSRSSVNRSIVAPFKSRGRGTGKPYSRKKSRGKRFVKLPASGNESEPDPTPGNAVPIGHRERFSRPSPR